MGAEARRPPSPLFTDSSVQSPADVARGPTSSAHSLSDAEHRHHAPTDLATDLSRRTDITHHSIPEDGRPLTLSTSKGVKSGGDPSQTSLLIEFFEGAKGETLRSKPSVRVRVRPSKNRGGESVKITESIGAGQPAYAHHVSLAPGEALVSRTVDSDADSTIHAPLDIDVRPLDLASDLTSTTMSNAHYSNVNPSEISSMPPESDLGAPPPVELTPTKNRSRSPSRAAMKETLDAPKARDASVSRERLTQKVIEKLGQEPRKVSGGKALAGKSRSRSASKENLVESTSSARRRSGKHRRSSGEHGSDPSLLTASQVSENRSYRSGTSKSSINNPKLLETVEDAIRRLILPELTALKKEQNTQKNLAKFEGIDKGRRESAVSGSSESREELVRRLSKHSSDPNVRLHRKRRSHGHGSEETVVRDEKPLRRRSKGDSHHLRDAAAGALIGGVLTREALKHHDSQSSVERRERRRRRSKTHSRSHSRHDSIADTDELFEKHDVPPMPMRSELTGSDLTRDSILSERRATPTSERRHHEIRQIARSSPRKARSLKELEYDDLDYPETKSKGLARSEEMHNRDEHTGKSHDTIKAGLTGVALGAGAAQLANYHSQAHYYDELDEHPYGGGHTLSPIQSVASFEEAHANPEKAQLRRVHSTGSISSLEHQHIHGATRSLDSTSSRDDTHIHHGGKGLGQDGVRDLEPHSFKLAEPADYDDQHRDSMDLDSPLDTKHLSYNTNVSEATSYGDRVAAAQEIRGVGANPEYINTPVAVESAVASLLDLDSATQSGVSERVRPDPMEGDFAGSPIKRELRQHYDSTRDTPIYSPRQSAASPVKDGVRSSGALRSSQVPMTYSGAPDMNDPLPEIGHFESKSDISTNPSEIQGTAGGYGKGKESWLFNQSREKVKSDNGSAHDSLQHAARNAVLAATAGGGVAALAQRGSHKELEREGPTESYDQPRYYEDNRNEEVFTPQRLDRQLTGDEGDEGYATGVPPERSPSLTPDHRNRAPPIFDAGEGDELVADPFTSAHGRTSSGNSRAVDSPLYDSAMGTGIDRIESKDIVALMNHLTVRDSQRSARDTEMITTLVQSATEMRTSFEDMKRLIQEQGDIIVQTGHKQHEKTQRVLTGPRPFPTQPTRTNTRDSTEDVAEDIPLKRRSAFRRALKGLGGRSNGDIARLESMLNHLLDEVAELKVAQGLEAIPPPHAETSRSNGLTSYENLRDGPQSGYEPDGQAGTGSTANNSGYFSTSSLRQSGGVQGFGRRRPSENRVSTVLEADEDEDETLEPHEQEVLDYDNSEQLLTPTREKRGVSVPLATPPVASPQNGAMSNENTPRTDKGRKHKSSSSSFFPKFSRWSRTTASTVADNVRASTQRNGNNRDRRDSQLSHSGSDNMDQQSYDVRGSYDPQGDDRLRSATSLTHDGQRPPSPLVPSSVSQEPTYQAHRDSMNLQHPRPRPGPTARILADDGRQMQNLSPVTPTSDQFGSNPVLARFGGGGFSGGAGNRYSGHSGAGNLSPISDATGATPPPPRPPKVRDDGPLVPPKVPLDEAKPARATGTYGASRDVSAVSFIQSETPTRSPNQRKPSGPRAMAASSSVRAWTPDRVQTQPRTRYRGIPDNLDSGEEDMTF